MAYDAKNLVFRNPELCRVSVPPKFSSAEPQRTCSSSI